MIYEIRAKKYMDVGSISLERYYKNKAKAEEVVEKLNEYLNGMYFVNEIKLEDEEQK
ncbi:hypothetical protein [Metabacillus fastidiosus]|uniref:hypothetical protein n=1 Tax=Metabacillus fastidiosus TaxID=1458 RepID=UPI003D2B15EB